MITILLLLFILGLMFPKPIKSLLNTSSSIIGKVLLAFSTGLIKVLGKIFKKTIQIIGSIIDWIIKIIVMLFDRIRF